jgi:hypothetical protein
MSGGSIGTIAGAVVGGIVGWFAGGNVLLGMQIGATIGGGVGTALDPPKGPKNSGPRLGDLTVQTSTYGATIPRTYGTLALFGNVFWLENNKLKEVATTESAGGKGMPGMGGSGETTTYAYFATFALGLCEGPIIGIRRIWIGPKLFYNAGSDNISTLIASNKNARQFRVYLGDEEQTADSRMQATLGVNNVPGYRGLAYIVFYDLPLADYGNTLLAAQIKVEVVCDGALGYVTDVHGVAETAQGLQSIGINSNASLAGVILDGPGSDKKYLQIVDIRDKSTPAVLGTASVRGDTPIRVILDGVYAYALIKGANYVQIFDISSPSNPTLISEFHWLGTRDPTEFGYSDDHIYVSIDQTNEVLVYNVVNRDNPYYVTTIQTSDQLTSPSDYPRGMIVIDDIGYLLLYGTGRLQTYDLSTPEYPVKMADVALSGSGVGTRSAMAVHDGYAYIVGFTRYVYVYDVSDPADPQFVAELLYCDNTAAAITKKIAHDNGHIFISLEASFFVINVADPVAPEYVTEIFYSSVGYSIQSYDYYIYLGTRAGTAQSDTGYLRIFSFVQPNITSNLVPLSDIVSAEALQSNLLTADDIDVTSLTPTVRGYRVSEVGAIRNAIEPLRAAWPFDVVQHGYQVKFVLRGTSSVAAITEGELDAREAGTQPGVQITNSREMDYILPRKVSIKHFDASREYDNGEQYAERINTDAVNVRDLELPIVLTAEEAAQKAEVLLYLYWMERYDIAFNLPPDYSELEPGDVITVETADADYELRLTSVVDTAAGRLECKAKYNSSALYIPAATGEEGQSTGVDLFEKGDTAFELLDIPMLQDVYDMPGFPVAMTGYLSGWPGGVLWRSDDLGQTWSAVQGFTRPGSTIGYASDTLSEHGGTVLDKSSVLTVRLYQGELSSVTEAQMFAGSNWFAYGADGRWEIIAAQNCVLQGDGSYIFSDFLRGQMGTEWATGLHQNGDKIVHLSSSELMFVSVNSSAIGAEKLYRGVTLGETLDTADDVAFTYNGVNLECLSPCHLTGNRHPESFDWTISWTRRSRFAGWRSYVDAELGEAAESYEIEIYSDGTYATLIRTLTAESSSVQYTASQQNEDFVDPEAVSSFSVTLTNPGAETGNTTGWTNELGALGVRSSGPGAYDGTYYFFGGTSAETRARQRVDIVAAGLDSGDIDNGRSYADLSAWMAGFPVDNDEGEIGIRFLNAAQATISTVYSGLVNRTDTWVLVDLRNIIPVGTRYIDVLLHAKRFSGTNNDAYFDDINLDLGVFLGLQDTLFLKIYQNSAVVGRGYPLISTITRE